VALIMGLVITVNGRIGATVSLNPCRPANLAKLMPFSSILRSPSSLVCPLATTLATSLSYLAARSQLFGLGRFKIGSDV